MPGHLPGEGEVTGKPLPSHLLLGKFDRETLNRRTWGDVSIHRHYRAGVEAAGEKRTYRDIGDQLSLDGSTDRVRHEVPGVANGEGVGSLGEGQLVVLPDLFDLAFPNSDRVARPELLY